MVAVLLVAGVISAGFYLRTSGSEVTIDSIAVLPFENRSNDPDGDYISDGITESINNSLTWLPNLKVVPHSIAFHYKGKAMDAQKVLRGFLGNWVRQLCARYRDSLGLGARLLHHFD
jgi:hypothetical protein